MSLRASAGCATTRASGCTGERRPAGASLRLVRSSTGTSSLPWLFQGGARAAESISGVLARNGSDIRNFRSILDFGCGCGRVIRHWAKQDAAVHGCDYNRKSVEWCRRSLTFARFEVNALTPPLPYADGQFDLVYALSVFTHLPEPLHFAWMCEMKRVLKTDGFLIFSTHGEPYLGDLTPDQQAEFHAGRVVVKDQDSAGPTGVESTCRRRVYAHTSPTDSASSNSAPGRDGESTAGSRPLSETGPRFRRTRGLTDSPPHALARQPQRARRRGRHKDRHEAHKGPFRASACKAGRLRVGRIPKHEPGMHPSGSCFGIRSHSRPPSAARRTASAFVSGQRRRCGLVAALAALCPS